MSESGKTLRALRERKQSLILEAEIATLERRKQFQELKGRALLENFVSGSQDLVTVWADLLDRWRDGQQFLSPLATANDRRQGKDFPFFQTEQDLAIYRGTARILVESVSYAKGLVRGLRSFVIGTGYTYKVKARRDGVRKEFVARVQEIIDEFCDRVRWKNLKRETFKRSVRDGEYFEHYGLGDDGKTWVRTVEPEQVIQPPGADWEDWSFGIRTPREDAQRTEAYWFCLMGNIAEGQEVEARDVIHFKRNTDRSVKRGLTDFCFDTYEALNIASKLRKAMGIGAAVQASIAYVREHQTADVGGATTFQQSDVNTSINNPISGTSMDVSYMEPGQRLDIPATLKYVPPPGAAAGGAAEGYVSILDASCRGAAAGWNAPEWLVHSNAQNMGAYTSSLVAESPFIVGIKSEQDEYAWADLQALLIVIRHAIEAGYLPHDTLEYVELTVEPPNSEHRDKMAEAQRDEAEIRAGFKSRQMAAQERGYDWEQVEADNQEYEERHPQGGSPFGMPGEGPPGGGGGFPGAPAAAMEAITEALRLRKAEKILLEAGFTGTVIDKRGRKLHYVNGRRVAAPQQPIAKGERRKKTEDERGQRGKGRNDTKGRGRAARPPQKAGRPVAGKTPGPAGKGDGEGRPASDRPAGTRAAARLPASVEEVNHRLERFTDFFRGRGQHEVADWMDKVKAHVNAVGTEAALKSLGADLGAGKGGETLYQGEAHAMGAFCEAYLGRHGITPLAGVGGLPLPHERVVSSVSPAFGAGSEDPYMVGDFMPKDPEFKDKLEESKHLPGLESSEDIGKIMGKDVTHLTDDVVAKMDERYGKGQWIIKAYGDDAFAGHGIYFPQRVAQIGQDARDTIWSAGEHLGKHGFELDRDHAGKIIGLKHQNGDRYQFGTDRYNQTIYGDARHWADRAAAAADNEHGPALFNRDGKVSGKEFMAQPAFKAVGISDAERARGVTGAEGGKGESRVHIVTKNGKAELVPHSTWIKGESLPVVFESDETRAIAQAAVDAINALPASEKNGQIYAPDVMRSETGWKVIEANPANKSGSSGYLGDNPFVIDSYVSHLTGRTPAHVQFIRKILTSRKRATEGRDWSTADRLLEGFFTGVITDKAGRKRRYVDGKPVAMGGAAKGKALRPAR